jgi:chitin synthase
MPILLTIGYYYSFKCMYDWIIGKGDIVGLVETVLFLCIPIIMCILLGKWRMMGYAFIFMLILPIFSIVIPLYSIYYSDDVSWGNTRKIEEIKMKEIKMKEIKMESLDTINIDVECKE